MKQTETNLFNLKDSLPESDRAKLLYEVAKLIDNEFIGAIDTATFDQGSEIMMITTNKCDNASVIQVYKNGCIKKVGPDTPGWVHLQPETIKRINECCNDFLTHRGVNDE